VKPKQSWLRFKRPREYGRGEGVMSDTPPVDL